MIIALIEIIVKYMFTYIQEHREENTKSKAMGQRLMGLAKGKVFFREAMIGGIG